METKIMDTLTEDVLRGIIYKFKNSSIEGNEPWVHFDATVDIELSSKIKITAIHVGGYSEGGEYDISFEFDLNSNERLMIVLASDDLMAYDRDDPKVIHLRTLWRALVIRHIWGLDVTFDEAKKEVSI